jgi:hypothetical protein
MKQIKNNIIFPFPGVVRYGGSNGTSILLTKQQEDWLRRYYPTQLSNHLASLMHIHRTSLTRLAKKLRLRKAAAYYLIKKELLSEKARNKIHSERLRDKWCLPRQTLYHLPQKPFTRQEIMRRHKAIERGYIPSADLSDKGRKRKVIYYDESTQRKNRFEANCIAAGFAIMEWKE